jgi:hypothetical protein
VEERGIEQRGQCEAIVGPAEGGTVKGGEPIMGEWGEDP